MIWANTGSLRMTKEQIEESARKQYEADHPNGHGWHNASHWIKETYREQVRKPPR